MECIRYVLNFLRNFTRSNLHKFDLCYFLTLEMTTDGGRGLHLNILLHIPSVLIGRSLQERLYKMFNISEEQWVEMKTKPFFLKGAKDFRKKEDYVFTKEFLNRGRTFRFLDLEGGLYVLSYMLKASDPNIVATKDGKKITYRELARLNFSRGMKEIALIDSGNIGLKNMVYCSQNICASRIKREKRYIEVDPIWRSKTWIREFVKRHRKTLRNNYKKWGR